MRTEQELFDEMVAGLAEQGFERAYDAEEDRCQYVDGAGRRCAVGQLIPEDAPDIVWRCDEGLSVLIDVCREAGMDELAAEFQSHARFLVDAQEAHDNGSCPADMVCALRELAEDYELRIPEVLTSGTDDPGK